MFCSATKTLAGIGPWIIRPPTNHHQLGLNDRSGYPQNSHRAAWPTSIPVCACLSQKTVATDWEMRCQLMSSFVYNQWTGFTGERFRVQTFVVHRWWNRKREKNAGSPQKENGKESGPGKEISETNEGKSKRPRMYCKFGG